jgi:hypothetical protein
MREVFGERGNHHVQAARAVKPTEVGDAVNRQNPDKTQMNTGGISFRGCPRRGDRCGDTLKGVDSGFIKDGFTAKMGLKVVNYQAPYCTFGFFVAKRRSDARSGNPTGSQC